MNASVSYLGISQSIEKFGNSGENWNVLDSLDCVELDKSSTSIEQSVLNSFGGSHCAVVLLQLT